MCVRQKVCIPLQKVSKWQRRRESGCEQSTLCPRCCVSPPPRRVEQIHKTALLVVSIKRFLLSRKSPLRPSLRCEITPPLLAVPVYMAILNFIHSCPFCRHKEQCVRRKKCASGRGANFRRHVLLTKQVLLENEPSHKMSNARSFSLLAFLIIRIVHHLCAGTKVEKRQKSRS
jgi:hypothetical protein